MYKSGLKDYEYAREMITKNAGNALKLLFVQVFLGLWYIRELANIPFKFNNIFAHLGMKVPGSEPMADLGWLFIAKIMLVLLQLIALLYVLYSPKTASLKPA